MNKISAKIIADSLNTHGQRLTTFVLVFPRIVLAEFNTHRMLSRNSASSRAIPFKKMVKMVMEDPFIPIGWQKEHSGMQGNIYLQGDYEEQAVDRWLSARNRAAEQAEYLSELGVTKQLCNRLLEPFLYHTVIVTASEWENFFALRAHPDAEIHICDLAQKMLSAYNENEPKQLKEGEWHIPFGENIGSTSKKWMDLEYAIHQGNKISWEPNGFDKAVEQAKVKIATARCARVSYMNFEGKDDYEADIMLHDRLINAGHFSPTEHCAMAMDNDSWYGNFRGWKQYRKFLSNENKSDSRIGKKSLF